MKTETKRIWVNETWNEWMYADEFERYYGREWLRKSGGLNSLWRLEEITARISAWKLAEMNVKGVADKPLQHYAGPLTVYRWKEAQPWLEVDDD